MDRKVMAALIVAILCIAGIGTAIAYTATVNNSGNNSGADGMAIDFYSAATAGDEIANGQLLKKIELNSVRTGGTTTWTFAGDKSLLKGNTFIHAVDTGVTQVTGKLEVTISGVTLSNVVVKDLAANFGETVGSIDISTANTIKITFNSVKIGSTGLQLTFGASDEDAVAEHFVGFKIESSTVSAVFTVTPPA